MKLFAIAVLIPSLAFSQSFQGSLRGRVVDPRGAATPQAKVRILTKQHHPAVPRSPTTKVSTRSPR